jgi:hypothetical protein
MDELIESPAPPRFSRGAFWLASIRNMVAGAALEGVPEDQIYQAVCDAIEEAEHDT